METATYLFVYGTLMRRFSNRYALLLRQHSRFVGEGCFPGYLYSKGAYPTAVYDEQAQALVYGELYALADEAVLHTLDRYEGIGAGAAEHVAEYRRIRIMAKGPNGPVQCWAYVDNAGVEGLERIDAGRF